MVQRLASVAQSVEHPLGKGEVSGSSLPGSSKRFTNEVLKQLVIAVGYGAMGLSEKMSQFLGDLDFVIDQGRLRGLQLAGMLGDLQERFNKGVDLLTITGIANGSVDGKPSFKQGIEEELLVVYEQ